MYWMMGYGNTFDQFIKLYAVNVLSFIFGMSLGHISGTLSPQPEVAASIGALIAFPFVFFGGYFTNNGGYPVWIGWIQYINPIKYIFLIEITNECKGRRSLI
jgi:ABC-type multidrug transport system permease subunit